jgi:hypothetical protein
MTPYDRLTADGIWTYCDSSFPSPLLLAEPLPFPRNTQIWISSPPHFLNGSDNIAIRVFNRKIISSDGQVHCSLLLNEWKLYHPRSNFALWFCGKPSPQHGDLGFRLGEVFPDTPKGNHPSYVWAVSITGSPSNMIPVL